MGRWFCGKSEGLSSMRQRKPILDWASVFKAGTFGLICWLTFAIPIWAAPETKDRGLPAYIEDGGEKIPVDIDNNAEIVAPDVQAKGIDLVKLEVALPPSARDVQAKIEYCQVCHQPLGQGFRGVPPVPRLAGQQIDYFVNQLRAFIEHRRVHPIMVNVAQYLSPAMQRALAEHFRGLNPKPIGGASKELVTAGKKVYEEGAPDANVPPCALCHGSEAKGNGPFPRLAGQLDDYIQNKLLNWSKERGQDPQKQDTSAIMQPIAHSLTKEQIAAVAAYLNYLE